MKRPARNQVAVLTEADKALLRELRRLDDKLPYPPVLVDVSTRETYHTYRHRLYKLERENWINIFRKGKTIRAIEVLMLP